MSLRGRPLWYEGQLLRPQHLQHLTRWTEGLVERRLAAVDPFSWGLRSLRVDASLLLRGQLALESLSAVLPDGTPVDAPSEDALPPARAIPPDAAGKRILLAVPVRAGDGPETARLEPRSQVARDTTGDAPEAEIPIGLPRLSLLIEGEPLDERIALPLARVLRVETSGALVLDDGFVPPCVTLRAHPAFQAFAREVAGMLAARADALAARVDPSRAGADVTGMVTFALLQLMNRAEPVFAELAQQKDAAPVLLYHEALRLAGELATFARVGRRPGALPSWSHLDPGPPLAALLGTIREAMATLATESAVALPLIERGPGVWVSPITDRALLRGAVHVLAARAEMDPERLRATLPQQIKIAPVEAIRDLVNLQLPGIRARPMPVAPRELPFRTGTVYLELDRTDEHWASLATSPAFALHVGSEFPGLALEFWAIRQG